MTKLAGDHVTDRFVHVWRHVMGRWQADTITRCIWPVRERRIDDHLKLRERSQIIVGRHVALLDVQHDATADKAVLLGTAMTRIEVWREEVRAEQNARLLHRKAGVHSTAQFVEELASREIQVIAKPALVGLVLPVAG